MEVKKNKWLIESAIMLGLAISVKLLAFASLLVFTMIIIYLLVKDKQKSSYIFKSILTYWVIALVVPLPWFMFSFVHTGNPIYPVFSKIFQGINHQVFNIYLLNPINFIKTSWKVLTQSSDPISPVYIISLPVIIITFKKLNFHAKIIFLYSFLGFIYWYFISRIEGARLLVSYLPAMSLISAVSFSNIHTLVSRKIGITIIALTLFMSIAYRSMANYKYLPVILGKESKADFLIKHLNFSFGDFYDTDSYFKNNIKQTDTVLLYGFHNLYYVEFTFIDSSWVKKGDAFNYIATQNAELPKQFYFWSLVYKNPKTHVNLYSLGGQKWVY